MMKKAKMIIFGMMVTAMTATGVFAAEMSFNANLSGNDEVPTVKTVAKGDAKFDLSSDSKTLTYKVRVENIENANAAHIHHGATGKNGAPVANLFTGPKKDGKFNGGLAEGSITAKDLVGDLKGKTVEDLVQIIKAGEAYVNVHTDANAEGEIRGQLK